MVEGEGVGTEVVHDVVATLTDALVAVVHSEEAESSIKKENLTVVLKTLNVIKKGERMKRK